MRILHLTDFHLRRALPGTANFPLRRGREIPDLLDLLGRRLAELAPDVVVATGDLVDVPFELVHDRSRDQTLLQTLVEEATADYRYLKQRFGESGVPWIAIPGNHDFEPAFDGVFRTPPIRDIGGVRFVTFRDREHAGHVPWRLGKERDLFDAVLTDPGHERPQVHVQHYVIEPEIIDPYPHMYGDRAELAARLGNSTRVACVLSGHYHCGRPVTVHGGAVYSVCPTLCTPPHVVRLLEIDEGDHSVSALDFALRPFDRTRPRAAVFVARGCLIEKADHRRERPRNIAIRPGVAGALGRLKKAGWWVLCVSPRFDLDGAPIDWQTAVEFHNQMGRLLRKEGVSLEGYYVDDDAPCDGHVGATVLERAEAELNVAICGAPCIHQTQDPAEGVALVDFRRDGSVRRFATAAEALGAVRPEKHP